MCKVPLVTQNLCIGIKRTSCVKLSTIRCLKRSTVCSYPSKVMVVNFKGKLHAVVFIPYCIYLSDFQQVMFIKLNHVTLF